MFEKFDVVIEDEETIVESQRRHKEFDDFTKTHEACMKKARSQDEGIYEAYRLYEKGKIIKETEQADLHLAKYQKLIAEKYQILADWGKKFKELKEAMETFDEDISNTFCSEIISEIERLKKLYDFKVVGNPYLGSKEVSPEKSVDVTLRNINTNIPSIQRAISYLNSLLDSTRGKTIGELVKMRKAFEAPEIKWEIISRVGESEYERYQEIKDFAQGKDTSKPSGMSSKTMFPTVEVGPVIASPTMVGEQMKNWEK